MRSDPLERAVAKATRLVREGAGRPDVERALPADLATEVWTLASLRKRASDRFDDPWAWWFDEEGLRYATPDVVARARAERLSPHGDSALDVACGVGIQLVHLAQVFGEAIGIERVPARVELARRNAAAHGVEATVLEGDCLDPRHLKRLAQPDVVFCDPAREPEAPERRFGDLSPDVARVLETWCGKARAWCFELPPMMPPERVAPVLAGECEYTSLHGELNRLAVYGGEAAEVEQSALSLPVGERLTSDEPGEAPAPTDSPEAFVHHVDRAVLSAGLLGQLAARIGAPSLLDASHPRRTLLTGPTRSASAFAASFEVLDVGPWETAALRTRLDGLDVGKVTLRAAIDPEEYWPTRNALEQGLDGERHVHVWRLGDRAVVGEGTKGG